MPGARAAVQSSRCGKSPKEPWSDRATIRFTPFVSTKIWKGRRIFRLMSAGPLFDHGFRLFDCREVRLNFWFGTGVRRIRRLSRLRFFLGLVDRPDHVKGALGIVLELIVQDALAAIDRVFQTDVFSLDAAELLGREERLRQESLQPTGAADDVAVFR